MSEFQRLEALTQALLTAAARAGADQADAVALDASAVSVDVRAGALEHAERADGVEIGLRVLIGGRQASVSASDHSARTIEEMAARAVAMAREAPVDDTLGLADPDQLMQVCLNLVKNAAEALEGRPGARRALELPQRTGRIVVRRRHRGCCSPCRPVPVAEGRRRDAGQPPSPGCAVRS